MFKNIYITRKGSGITLSYNEIKNIMKVIKSLEIREILLKGTTTKTTSQKGGFLKSLTAGLPLIKNVLTPLPKIFLRSLGLTAAMSATRCSYSKKNKIHGSGATALIISNKEMEDIMKIVQSLEESGLLIKRVSETIKMKQKNKKENFFQCY